MRRPQCTKGQRRTFFVLLVAVVVSIPALATAECRFEVRNEPGEPSVLIRGASRQLLRMSIQGDDCVKQVRAGSTVLRLRDPASKMEVKGTVDRLSRTNEAVIRFEAISRAIPKEPLDWDVLVANERIGVARLQGDEITVGPVSVSYKDPLLDQKQNGQTSKDTTTGLSIAVTNPLIDARRREGAVTHGDIINSVSIDLPPALSATSDLNLGVWTLRFSSWGGDVYFAECRQLGKENGNMGQQVFLQERSASAGTDALWQSRGCELLRINPIVFEVSRRESSPLIIELQLQGQGGELLVMPLTLAAQSRRESLPLPISNITETSCETQAKPEQTLAQADTAQSEARAAQRELLSEQQTLTGMVAENSLRTQQIDFIRLASADNARQLQFLTSRLELAEKSPSGKNGEEATKLRQAIEEAHQDEQAAQDRLRQLKEEDRLAQGHLSDLKTKVDELVPAAEKKRVKAIELTSNAAKEIEGAKKKVLLNGSVRSLKNDDALRNGDCRLSLKQTSPLLLDSDLLELYGPQAINVVVVRNGDNADGSTLWTIEGPDAEFVLSPPLAESTPDKPYTIRAQISEQDSVVVYRPGAFAARQDGVRTGRDYSYEAKLRPRGPFGFNGPSNSVRYFLTVPLNVTGLRFPANPRDLTASSDAGHVQVTTLQAGLLGAVEPWDYDSGRPLWAVPLRFMAGMNLVDLNGGRFVPSILAGVSVTAPLLDSPSQFGTSVAIGIFWEADLRDEHPLETSHALITLGLNIFSLFAAE
jgi:hypothetical protein